MHSEEKKMTLVTELQIISRPRFYIEKKRHFQESFNFLESFGNVLGVWASAGHHPESW
jgi:hypothetical protein